MDRSKTIHSLRVQLAAARSPCRHASVATPLGMLRMGSIHEWIGPDTNAPSSGSGSAPGSAPRSAPRSASWSAPICVLVGLARAITKARHASGILLWVGARCHPTPQTLIARETHPATGQTRADRSLLDRSVFIDAPDAATRLWAIDVALRSSAIACVVGDAQHFDMAATRRLQLAAEQTGTVALLARPYAERRTLSAASSRWLVTPAPRVTAPHVHPSKERSRSPCWQIELLRQKGLGLDHPHDAKQAIQTPRDSHPSPLYMEWDHHACALIASSPLEHRPCVAPAEPQLPLRLAAGY